MVLQPVLTQKIDAVGFLEELIAHIGFVRQNPSNGRVAPLLLPGGRRDALSRQRLCNLERGVTREEISEDATDYFCLLLVDDQPSVLALVVAEEVLVVQTVSGGTRTNGLTQKRTSAFWNEELYFQEESFFIYGSMTKLLLLETFSATPL